MERSLGGLPVVTPNELSMKTGGTSGGFQVRHSDGLRELGPLAVPGMSRLELLKSSVETLVSPHGKRTFISAPLGDS